MRIVCLIKFVPDVEEFKYDHANQALVRENSTQILNPDDACALAFALLIKRGHPETVIEVVTMAPGTVKGQLEDLLRRNLDTATLLSDTSFAGSDTLATAGILARYLQSVRYDVILTGTHSLDGDTSHVPSQVAEACGLAQMSNIVAIDPASFWKGEPEIEVDQDREILRYRIALPAILSLSKDSGYKLPYVAYADLEKDVASQLRVLSNGELGLDRGTVGLTGSRTRVKRTFTKTWPAKTKTLLKCDTQGIEIVFRYLEKNGLLP
ncbi:MAG: hypothetical protein WCG80_16290 [Spirochaetales bacterium]